jgi:hypothetical protein
VVRVLSYFYISTFSYNSINCIKRSKSHIFKKGFLTDGLDLYHGWFPWKHLKFWILEQLGIDGGGCSTIGI